MIRWLKRPVGGAVSHFEKERLRPVLFDEPDGPRGDQIGHISLLLNGLGVLEQSGEAIASSSVGIVIDVPAQEAEKGVEPVRVRAELGFVTQVPFSNQGRRIPIILQEPRQGATGRRKSVLE